MGIHWMRRIQTQGSPRLNPPPDIANIPSHFKAGGSSKCCHYLNILKICSNYSRTSMARISLPPWKFFRDTVSWNHWWSIMTQGQEANGDNFGIFFSIVYTIMVCWVYSLNCVDEAILMSTTRYNFMIKKEKNPLNMFNFIFLSYLRIS